MKKIDDIGQSRNDYRSQVLAQLTGRNPGTNDEVSPVYKNKNTPIVTE